MFLIQNESVLIPHHDSGLYWRLTFHKSPLMVLCAFRAAPMFWDVEQSKENAVLRLDWNVHLLILEPWQWLKTFPSTNSSPLLLQELKSIDTKVKHKSNDILDFWVIGEKQNQKWPPTLILPFLIILKKKALIEQSGFASLPIFFFLIWN